VSLYRELDRLVEIELSACGTAALEVRAADRP
jgi:hypothetical protein